MWGDCGTPREHGPALPWTMAQRDLQDRTLCGFQPQGVWAPVTAGPGHLGMRIYNMATRLVEASRAQAAGGPLAQTPQR